MASHNPHQPQPQQLVVAVHHVATPTAKVPFAMILLLDFAKRRATPAHSKCRTVLPSDGETSISLWDTTDTQGLLEWLSDNLGADCTTVLHEVQEDFTFGLSLDLARMRAADKVADGSLKLTGALGETTSKAAGALAAGVTTAVGSTQQKLEEFDQRTGVISSAKETTVVIAQRAMGVMSKAAEDKRVQGVVTSASAGWTKLSSWVGDRMRDINLADGTEDYGGGQQQQYSQQQPATTTYSPSQDQVHMPSQYSSYAPSQQQQQGGGGVGGGGLLYTASAEQPRSSTKSMLEEPAVPASSAAAAPAPPAAAGGVAGS